MRWWVLCFHGTTPCNWFVLMKTKTNKKTLDFSIYAADDKEWSLFANRSVSSHFLSKSRNAREHHVRKSLNRADFILLCARLVHRRCFSVKCDQSHLLGAVITTKTHDRDETSMTKIIRWVWIATVCLGVFSHQVAAIGNRFPNRMECKLMQVNYSSLSCHGDCSGARFLKMNGDIFHFKASQSDDVNSGQFSE